MQSPRLAGDALFLWNGLGSIAGPEAGQAFRRTELEAVSSFASLPARVPRQRLSLSADARDDGKRSRRSDDVTPHVVIIRHRVLQWDGFVDRHGPHPRRPRSKNCPSRSFIQVSAHVVLELRSQPIDLSRVHAYDHWRLAAPGTSLTRRFLDRALSGHYVQCLAELFPAHLAAHAPVNGPQGFRNRAKAEGKPGLIGGKGPPPYGGT